MHTEGLDSVNESMQNRLWPWPTRTSRWPDLTFEEHTLYLAADTGVAEWTARATAADGRHFEWDGIDVINCRDGLIIRNAVYSSGHRPRVLGPA